MTKKDKQETKEVTALEVDHAPEPSDVSGSAPSPVPSPTTPRRGPDLSLAAHRKRLGLK